MEECTFKPKLIAKQKKDVQKKVEDRYNDDGTEFPDTKYSKMLVMYVSVYMIQMKKNDVIQNNVIWII